MNPLETVICLHGNTRSIEIMRYFKECSKIKKRTVWCILFSCFTDNLPLSFYSGTRRKVITYKTSLSDNKISIQAKFICRFIHVPALCSWASLHATFNLDPFLTLLLQTFKLTLIPELWHCAPFEWHVLNKGPFC